MGNKKKTHNRKKIDFEEMPIVENNSLPLIWADVLRMAVRVDDNLATLQFYAMFPENSVEQARVQVSLSHIKRMLDLMARSIDYYPTKPTEEKTPIK